MIHALWFTIKAALAIGIILFCATIPGDIIINLSANDFILRVHWAICAAIIILFILVLLTVHKWLVRLELWPEKLHLRRTLKRQEKGLGKLVEAQNAIAAGRGAEALKAVKRAQMLIQNDHGMSALLTAQAARQVNDRNSEAKAIDDLLGRRETEQLATRALINLALREQDYTQARNLGQHLERIDKHHKDTRDVRFSIALEAKDWEQALKYAPKKHDKPHDVTAVHLALALDHDKPAKDCLKQAAKAYHLAPDFLPAVIVYTRLLAEQGNHKSAQKLIISHWARMPHPELAEIWLQTGPANTRRAPEKFLKHGERLITLAPNTAESYLAAAKAAMRDRHWQHARGHLTSAQDIEANTRVFMLWADLEERSRRDERAAQAWIERAEEAQAGSVWYCRQTGHIYESWSPIAKPHNAFNTIEWGIPKDKKISNTPVHDGYQIAS